MRTYSKVDLLRFRKFSLENPEMNNLELLKSYDEKFPELTVKQQWEYMSKALGLNKNGSTITGRREKL